MANDKWKPNFPKRIRKTKYSRDACIAALRGKKVPHVLGHPLHRLCVIRGIRYHHGFGAELRGVLPVFTRALNARSIMSDEIPDMNSPDEIPYCIWHPATASEETYRALAIRYPGMAYQVGRACAVAGYTQLFRELDLLPDVHIAEEARECGNSSIYEAIVSQPVRYNIMNDYERSIDVETRVPAYLNGDTAVRWMLDVKQEFSDATSSFESYEEPFFDHEMFYGVGYKETTFNITEDKHIDEYETDSLSERTLATRGDDLILLHEPLPLDLPTMQKDLLIAAAAYYGNVDRYARLRRPKISFDEDDACVHGIYHNTLFARWWAEQPGDKSWDIEKAINARFIMNNVLSRMPSKYTPYLIWWPTIARPKTYEHLAKLQPDMLPSILHACIYAEYYELFIKFLPQVTPTKAHMEEADDKKDLRFHHALCERLDALGIDPVDCAAYQRERTSRYIRSNSDVWKHLDERIIGSSYHGELVNASRLETMVCLPDSWKIPKDDESYMRELDYETWPPPRTEA